ncbi:MAG: hypothetical protein FJX29_00620 [Alphaproteobacteria bacterium]|nr:hypothetical protein [Alphaproteobacteria bacterium]
MPFSARMRQASATCAVILAGLAFATLFAPTPAQASGGNPVAGQTGRETGLRVPRYVSLKSDRVNLRQGPAKEHKTLWVFRRAGLPVEITAEFENWRRIRDADGDEGWVLHSLLSGRRTAVIAPWKKSEGQQELLELRASATAEAPVTARVEPRVVASVRRCDGKWCRISGRGFDGFIPQDKLWGVYPDEALN